jgi:hypothetical protein
MLSPYGLKTVCGPQYEKNLKKNIRDKGTVFFLKIGTSEYILRLENLGAHTVMVWVC